MKEQEKKRKEFVKLYVPELMQIMDNGDEKSCLMMAQLEYWFGLKPDSFYKFMTMPKEENPFYHQGDSWVEEMGMSKDKINSALKPICTQYKSFTEYKNSNDKFKGKYYCSYYHKLSHLTYYFRNHDKVNEALESLSLEKKSPIFREKHSLTFGKTNNSISGTQNSEITDTKNNEVVYTENNAKTTTKRERTSLSNTHVNQIKTDSDCIEFGDITTEETVVKSTRKIQLPFPDDFELTNEMISWAESKKPGIDIHNSTEKFIVTKQNQLSENWEQSWQLWILREEIKKSVSSSSWQERKDVYANIKGMFADVED